MTKQQRFYAIVAAALLAAATVAQAQVLVNGSFETGDFYGWEVTGSVSPAQTVYGTTDGTYAVGLNCGSSNPADGVLTQSFASVPGGHYTLALDLGAFGAVSPIVLSAKVLGVAQAPVLDESASVTTYRYNTEWTHAQWDFVANSPTSTLVLRDISPTSWDVDGVLDNVSVMVVPEPGAIGLIAALGLMGLAVWRKSRA